MAITPAVAIRTHMAAKIIKITNADSFIVFLIIIELTKEKILNTRQTLNQ
ncbi:MAG: hypothetical protein QNJ36_00745 [Calothrix sp. MO_167.B42]|nr:hypothetical protein [Calothrix sp. MO_167.B42]